MKVWLPWRVIRQLSLAVYKTTNPPHLQKGAHFLSGIAFREEMDHPIDLRCITHLPQTQMHKLHEGIHWDAELTALGQMIDNGLHSRHIYGLHQWWHILLPPNQRIGMYAYAL